MRRLGTILADRRLIARDTGEVVRVSLGMPRPGTDGADWECPFRIHGAGVSRIEFGYGVDSMQALTTALDGIRARLDESGLALGWKVGAGRRDVFDGETGFTRSIPIAFGPTRTRRLERLLDQELRRELQRLQRRSKRRPAAKARKARKAR